MTDTVRDPRITDLIRFAANGNPVEFQNAFNDIVTDRLAVAVDARKIEVAKHVFNDAPVGDTQEAEPQEEDNTNGEES